MSQSRQEGFTIAELLIVIAIMGLLTTFVMVNFQRGNRSNELRQAGTELFQNIRLAQGYSVGGNSIYYCIEGSSSNKFGSCLDDTGCGGTSGQFDLCKNGVPLGGFGIHIDSTAGYKLFANTDYENFHFQGNDQVIISKDYILKGITIDSFKLGESVYQLSGGNTLDIIFEPPLGTIHFYVSTSASEEINLSLLVKSGYISNTCRKITINRISGQISESQSECSL